MEDSKMKGYIKAVLENMPADWLNLTTHRLDIYTEKLAKTEFLEKFELLFHANNTDLSALKGLPTAFDYIRLGHPLSCLLEWAIAKRNHLDQNNVISFSSKTIPIFAILRKNTLENKNTQINYINELPDFFDVAILRNIYGYAFELNKIETAEDITPFDGSTIFISEKDVFKSENNNSITGDLSDNTDFLINVYPQLGSIVIVNENSRGITESQSETYVSEIQHVRRRETIAMTPADCHTALLSLAGSAPVNQQTSDQKINKSSVLESIAAITGTGTIKLLGSSGLSIQYAIMMGLIHEAKEKHKGKNIKIIIPPNCYGGTNDQARRVAACIDQVEVVDLPVDGDNDMVNSLEQVLTKIAEEDAVPYIIAEIPTNPRVEVPDLISLKNVLNKERKTAAGENAIDPVFILDQTFCPNVHFLGEGEILSTIRTICYVSGSKFPSGGLCTAGYCVGNKKTEALINKIETHLKLCDNEATNLQIEVLAKQLPSMKQRINDAYKNARSFVTFINDTLPEAKINFVSEELVSQDFTPSVFSLDLPSKGDTDEEKESYQKEINHTLINLMIKQIPHESKFCVSYGQLKGCYWTIPATSTQGTTKEADKDYIVRVSLSPDMDVELHKKVFLKFVAAL